MFVAPRLSFESFGRGHIVRTDPTVARGFAACQRAG
jgi:hypothetical protein